LHSAADTAIDALEAHRIREDNIMIVQGKRWMKKMVYLRFALAINYFLCIASAPISNMKIQVFYIKKTLAMVFVV